MSDGLTRDQAIDRLRKTQSRNIELRAELEAANARKDRLRAEIEWVINDMAYKAPEQMNRDLVMFYHLKLSEALKDETP